MHFEFSLLCFIEAVNIVTVLALCNDYKLYKMIFLLFYHSDGKTNYFSIFFLFVKHWNDIHFVIQPLIYFSMEDKIT